MQYRNSTHPDRFRLSAVIAQRSQSRARLIVRCPNVHAAVATVVQWALALPDLPELPVVFSLDQLSRHGGDLAQRLSADLTLSDVPEGYASELRSKLTKGEAILIAEMSDPKFDVTEQDCQTLLKLSQGAASNSHIILVLTNDQSTSGLPKLPLFSEVMLVSRTQALRQVAHAICERNLADALTEATGWTNLEDALRQINEGVRQLSESKWTNASTAFSQAMDLHSELSIEASTLFLALQTMAAALEQVDWDASLDTTLGLQMWGPLKKALIEYRLGKSHLSEGNWSEARDSFISVKKLFENMTFRIHNSGQPEEVHPPIPQMVHELCALASVVIFLDKGNVDESFDQASNMRVEGVVEAYAEGQEHLKHKDWDNAVSQFQEASRRLEAISKTQTHPQFLTTALAACKTFMALEDSGSLVPIRHPVDSLPESIKDQIKKINELADMQDCLVDVDPDKYDELLKEIFSHILEDKRTGWALTYPVLSSNAQWLRKNAATNNRLKNSESALADRITNISDQFEQSIVRLKSVESTSDHLSNDITSLADQLARLEKTGRYLRLSVVGITLVAVLAASYLLLRTSNLTSTDTLLKATVKALTFPPTPALSEMTMSKAVLVINGEHFEVTTETRLSYQVKAGTFLQISLFLLNENGQSLPIDQLSYQWTSNSPAVEDSFITWQNSMRYEVPPQSHFVIVTVGPEAWALQYINVMAVE